MYPDLHQIKGLRSYLRELHSEHTEKYCALFIKAKPVAIRELPAGWESLVESRLCDRQDDMLLPAVLVTKVFDLFVATDLPHYKGSDRVLYLADQDSLLLARHMPNLTGKRHLDIGSGSGVLGLSASAHGARHVTASAVAVARQSLPALSSASSKRISATRAPRGNATLNCENPWLESSFRSGSRGCAGSTCACA